jgi:hypothetical protein
MLHRRLGRAEDPLIAAFATEYRCELPGDAEALKRIGHRDGDALRNLVAAGAVPPADVLPVGLAAAPLVRAMHATLKTNLSLCGEGI